VGVQPASAKKVTQTNLCRYRRGEGGPGGAGGGGRTCLCKWSKPKSKKKKPTVGARIGEHVTKRLTDEKVGPKSGKEGGKSYRIFVTEKRERIMREEVRKRKSAGNIRTVASRRLSLSGRTTSQVAAKAKRSRLAGDRVQLKTQRSIPQ